MVKERKKYESGAATRFISRNRALRKLQLSLADFRRLCILKGIYPHEPHNKRKAAKGNRGVQTFFYVKDIQYISHEPIINTFRSLKIYMRKINKARHKGNNEQVKRLTLNKPKVKIDHIVKERYPSFIDAVRDLDDCLTLCFVFATFPKSKAYIDIIKLCRRLTVEFLYYVIASRSLRKVFVSIKGMYYQAEIMGQVVTWIVPHKRAFQSGTDVDFRIMQTFVQFYTTFLGFVNYQLYTNLNLHYPPKLYNETDKTAVEAKCTDWEVEEELIASLSATIKGENNEPMDDNIDEYPVTADEEDEAIIKAREELKLEKQQRSLFDGLKFFLNRECPREDLTFMIRCFGGQVSWDSTSSLGATFSETDESITHHIVDRPSVQKQYISRYYVQPQWVFDSINARRLLPENDYFMGATLPPHLSPFITAKDGDYDPRSRHDIFQSRKNDDLDQGDIDESEDDIPDNKPTQKTNSKAIPIEEKIVPQLETDDGSSMVIEKDAASDSDKTDESDSDNSDDDKEDTIPEQTPKTMRKMYVKKGKLTKVHPDQKHNAANEERKLAEMMIPKKKRRLYHKIITARKKNAQEVRALVDKRDLYEKAEKRKQLKQKHKTT